MSREQNKYFVEPGQSIKIDLFRPGDAEGVGCLFRTIYGDGYPIKKFLHPELLIEENNTGRTISSVARTPQGDIVGHNALFNSAPYSGIYESGAGLVLPSYRATTGIFTKLVAHGQEITAKEFDMEAIYGESVCNHIYTQRMATRLGWITQAIEVDLMPAEAYDKEKSASGRVASLLDFKTLKPKPHTVYLTTVYEEALQFFYSGLDDERQFASADKDFPPGSNTNIMSQVFDFALVARLAVHEAGADFKSAFDEQEKMVQEKGVVVIQVWLKLSWPWIGRVVDVLRERGYFLGGMLPRWFDVDGLLMQKIIGKPNWEGIQLHSDRAKMILEIARKDWETTAG